MTKPWPLKFKYDYDLIYPSASFMPVDKRISQGERDKASINECDERGITYLQYAIRYRAPESVDKLLRRYGMEDIDNLFNVVLLASENLEMLKVLRKHGVHFNIYDQDGFNLLFYSDGFAREDPEKAIEVIRYLVDNGLQINSRAKNGMSVCCPDLSFDSFNHLRVFTECGAHPDLVRNQGWESQAAIHDVYDYNYEDLEKMLNMGAYPDIRDGEGRTPLYLLSGMRASDDETLDMMHMLIERGASLEARCDSGYTPLAVAVLDSSNIIDTHPLEKAILLLEAGANPHVYVYDELNAKLSDLVIHNITEDIDEDVIAYFRKRFA